MLFHFEIINFINLVFVFLIALSFHEAAHAAAANFLGDPTAKNAGRLTLDPRAHLDPIGAIAIFLFHFGWGKPVPVNPHNFKNPRRDDALVAIAGPAANFFIAFLATGFLTFFSHSLGAGVSNFFEMLLAINLLFGVFNLFPLPPLDGGAVFVGLLPKKIAPPVEIFLKKNGPVIFFTALAIDLFFKIPLITGPVIFVSGKIQILFSLFWANFL